MDFDLKNRVIAPRLTRRAALIGGVSGLILPSLSAAQSGQVPAGAPQNDSTPTNPSKEAPRRFELVATQGRQMQVMDHFLRPGWQLGLADGGPLRIKAGESVVVALNNMLEEPINLQLRGWRNAQVQSVARVDKRAKSEFSLQIQDSGVYLLQALDLGQIARGLSMALIVEEAAPPLVHLDMPLLVQDWERRDPPILSLNGITRDSAAPISTLNLRPNTRLRLRMLNATASRGFLTRFSGMIPYIVAIDSTPSEMFRPRQDTFPFGPGARYDVMFDVPASGEAKIVLDSGTMQQGLISVKAEGEAREALPAIAALPPNPALPPEIELARAQRFECVFFAANALKNFDLKRDVPTSLSLINKSGTILSVFMGGHSVRVLHPADDGWEPYWRDSLILAAGQTVHVALMPRQTGKFYMEGVKIGSFDAPDRIALNVV